MNVQLLGVSVPCAQGLMDECGINECIGGNPVSHLQRIATPVFRDRVVARVRSWHISPQCASISVRDNHSSRGNLLASKDERHDKMVMGSFSWAATADRPDTSKGNDIRMS